MLVYEVVFVCLVLKTFYDIFVMFVNEEVSEIVPIISSCSDYVFSSAILIFKVLM